MHIYIYRMWPKWPSLKPLSVPQSRSSSITSNISKCCCCTTQPRFIAFNATRIHFNDIRKTNRDKIEFTPHTIYWHYYLLYSQVSLSLSLPFSLHPTLPPPLDPSRCLFLSLSSLNLKFEKSSVSLHDTIFYTHYSIQPTICLANRKLNWRNARQLYQPLHIIRCDNACIPAICQNAHSEMCMYRTKKDATRLLQLFEWTLSRTLWLSPPHHISVSHCLWMCMFVCDSRSYSVHHRRRCVCAIRTRSMQR